MPDNAFYYQLAYGVTLLMYGGYALSLVLRRRTLARRRRRHAAAAARPGAGA
ncbi:MAG: hypothetical protein ACYC0B_04555 [Gemmatimonadaceae bacterium]